MGTIGNTFDSTTKTWRHARKVWRSIGSAYPAGGTISNIADWADAGIIPAGTPAIYDAKNKTIKALTDEQVIADATGVNGYLQEDVVIANGATVGSNTVLYSGEIYEYMFDEAVATALKALTTTPQIVWVY